MSNPWEQLRHVTLDALVTHVKLAGAGAEVSGYTTPEGWAFVVLVAVGSPGNERAVAIANGAGAQLRTAAGWTREAHRPDED